MLKHLNAVHCPALYSEINLEITCKQVTWILIVPICIILTLAAVD